MGNDGVRVVPPLQTQEELEQAADEAVGIYGKTNDDRDAVTAANAINKAFRKTGSDDLKRALDKFDPQGGAVVGPATPRNQHAKNVVNTYEREKIAKVHRHSIPKAAQATCPQCGKPARVTGAPKRWVNDDGSEENVFPYECEGPDKHRGDFPVPVK